ncbi:hypothetical protein SESBI_14828 [Sesbania bispinosa]|nr:hypothetical protein SESBI_14828 [Sesbania bispinosa]
MTEQAKVMAVACRGGIGNGGRGNNFPGSGRGNSSSNRYFNSGGGGNANKICSFCGRSGHTVETCYKKHGFPPHFKFTKQNQN